MRHYSALLRTTLAALLMMLAIAGAVIAGPLDDALDRARAVCVSDNYSQAFRLCRRLAEQDNPDAQFKLSGMYEFGWGVEKDPFEALKWERRAAEHGNAASQFGLGNAYEYGLESLGVVQDFVEAAKWYRRAADQGDPVSQRSLAFMYEHGWGVPQDFVLAHMLYNLAVPQLEPLGGGYNSAAMDREYLEKRMTPAQIAEAQKLAREWKPKSER